MVTAIDTIEDVIRILRERPEVRAAVRREILTDDILELPARFAEMSRIIQEILATQLEILATLKQQAATLEEHGATLKQQAVTLNEHAVILNRHSAVLERQSVTLSEHSATLNEHSATLNKHSGDIDQLKRDVGELKGRAAYQTAQERYTRIAREMGLRASRLLTLEEIDDMADLEAASEYSPSQINSFRDCDLIIAAAHPERGDCYVTVQVSSVVDHGDVSRAIDHARMATRFTGKPAFPAVAGLEAADIAETRLASDAIHWHRIPGRHIQSR